MSGAAPRKTLGARIIQAAALVIIFGILLLATHYAPESRSVVGTVAGLGFLLLAGTLMSELVETIGLPHLSGYLIAGLIAGPHVLHLVDHEAVESLSVVNTLALALIALAGGAELRIDRLRESARTLAWALVVQWGLVLVTLFAAFMALARYIPFTQGFPTVAVVGMALLWAVLAMTRSPSAVLGVLSQLRPKGPVASFTLAFVMASDTGIVVLLSLALTITRVLVDPGATVQLSDFRELGHQLVGSMALGTTLGLVLALYLRFVGRQLLLVFLVIGFGLTELLHYVHLDPLLAFMVAGFAVQNFSNQGAKLLHEVEQAGAVIFVVFFATTGAHLDLPLLFRLWPIAVALAGARAIATYAAWRISAAITNEGPTTRRWGWSGLISQAGLTIGFSVVIARTFPDFGEGFRSLAIGVVALNEMFGPILFKLGLDRAGETSPKGEPISSHGEAHAER